MRDRLFSINTKTCTSLAFEASGETQTKFLGLSRLSVGSILNLVPVISYAKYQPHTQKHIVLDAYFSKNVHRRRTFIFAKECFYTILPQITNRYKCLLMEKALPRTEIRG